MKRGGGRKGRRRTSGGSTGTTLSSHWLSSTPHDTTMQDRHYVAYSALHKHINLRLSKYRVEATAVWQGFSVLYSTHSHQEPRHHDSTTPAGTGRGEGHSPPHSHLSPSAPPSHSLLLAPHFHTHTGHEATCMRVGSYYSHTTKKERANLCSTSTNASISSPGGRGLVSMVTVVVKVRS